MVSGICVALAYAAFSVADMVFSLRAFTLGVGEANPLMAGLASNDLFVPGKLALTAVVAVLLASVYPRGVSKPVAWGVLGLMALVNVYHVWGLSAVL